MDKKASQRFSYRKLPSDMLKCECNLLFNKNIIFLFGIFAFILLAGCCADETAGPVPEVVPVIEEPTPEPVVKTASEYPKIASWLAKKDEIIESKKPYSLIMTGWVTPEEAEQMRSQNSEVKLLAGLSLNWIWENEEWIEFLETVASYGKSEPYAIKEGMYLKTPEGEKCAFGWASEEWAHEEIYAMDPRNPEWRELILAFHSTLDQPQHDGIMVDMVVDKQYWCPEAITDEEWVFYTKELMRGMQENNPEGKLVIFNAGLQYEDIEVFKNYMDGFLLENFMGEWGATYEQGLAAADHNLIVIYAVDTDNTGEVDLNKMRLGLTLSLLNDNTYFTYDFGTRDHGGVWWFSEFDVELGAPLGAYYEKDGAYWRDFEKGVVVSSPNQNVNVEFVENHVDATTGVVSKTFVVEAGDGRIYLVD